MGKKFCKFNWRKSFQVKTHLINIFLKKFKGIKIEANEINNEFLKKN